MNHKTRASQEIFFNIHYMKKKKVRNGIMNGNSWEWFGVSRDNENVCSLDHGALAETG